MKNDDENINLKIDPFTQLFSYETQISNIKNYAHDAYMKHNAHDAYKKHNAHDASATMRTLCTTHTMRT